MGTKYTSYPKNCCDLNWDSYFLLIKIDFYSYVI